MEEQKEIKITIGKSTGSVKIEYGGFADEQELFSVLYGVANRVQVEHRLSVIPAESLSGNPENKDA